MTGSQRAPGVATEAFLEFRRDGELGAFGIRLLYETVAAVARFNRYPTSEGSFSWSEDDARQFAHDLLTGPRGLERITGLFVRADDGESLERLIGATVLNEFRDRARASDRGHLHRRVRDVLNDDRFEQVPEGMPGAGRWRLVGAADEPWQGSVNDLVAAAGRMDVARVRWRADAAKRSPIADKDDLARLLEGVLSEADGSLDESTLVEVVVRRFGLAPSPLFVSLDASDEPGEPDLVLADPTEVGPEQVAAETIWKQLDDEERGLLMAVADGDTVREVALLADIGKSSVTPRSERLAAKIQRLMGDDPDETVAACLMELARRGIPARTGRPDPASEEHEGGQRA